MKIAPERLYLDIHSPFRTVVYYRPKGDNAEYIRADLVHPPERHQRLVEAAREFLRVICSNTIQNNESLKAINALKAALEGEG